MKNKLLQLAANISARGKHHNDEKLQKWADELADYASTLPEDSVSSSETNENETTDDGGIEVPKKPPPP